MKHYEPYFTKRALLFLTQKPIYLLMMLFLFSSHIAVADYFERITSGAPVDDTQQSYSATWADINNNGYDDLLILNLNLDEASALYINNGDGTFTESDNNGLTDHMGPSIAATWGDFNNNGHLDVYICNTANNGDENSPNFLFENNGDGTFTRITEGAIVNDEGWSLGATWADYNKNGHIDLYVANFDGPNYLYKNNGDGTFDKITSGDLVTDDDPSYGAYWADINNNGHQDLFVANAFGTTLPPASSNLYLNNGDGTFDKKETGHIVDNIGITHGASWGDYTNNGYLDLFVSNHDWHDNKVNFLYKNNGDGTFSFQEDINVTSDENTSFGSAWIDINNNGYLDLVVANHSSGDGHNYLYINNGDATFTKEENDPFASDDLRSFGLSVADYNNNGYQDIFTSTWSPSQENGFYQNLGGENNWLAINLEGTVSNRAAIGARIRVYTDELMQIREVNSASGQYGSSSYTQHFGLAQHATVDSLHVQWPSGIVNKWYNVDANQQLDLIEEEETGPVVLEIPWEEDFMEETLPAGWDNTDISGDGFLWEFEDGLAIADSDAAGSGNHMWSKLTTPPVDCSGEENVHLYLNHYYRHLGDSYGKISVSNDGENWEEVVMYDASTGNDNFPYFEYDISGIADGEEQVWLQFEFNDLDGWNWYWKINTIGMYSPDPFPAPATLVAPEDGDTNLPQELTLEWSPAGGAAPNAYRVYLDDSETPDTEIYDGPDTSLEIEGLEYSTTYYWRVVPYNEEGDASDVPVWMFTTGDDPTITEIPHTEDFDAVSSPDLPLGWSTHIIADSEAAVETSDFGGPVSEPNHIRFMNMDDMDAEMTLITPQIDINMNNLRIRFHAKELLSGDYGNNHLEVGVYDPDSDALTVIESIHLTTDYTEYILSLEDYDGDIDHLGFRALMGGNYQVVYFDDFILEESPTEPLFVVNPLSKDFGTHPIGSTSEPETFTMTNMGAGTITINPGEIAIVGNDAEAFILDTIEESVELGMGESETIAISFAPETTGEKSAVLEIEDNIGKKALHEIPLSGEAYDPVFSLPFAEDFTGAEFPPAEWTILDGLLEHDPELNTTNGIWTHHVFGNQEGDNNAAHINIYNDRQHWLVTPQIDLGENEKETPTALEFEIALTPWTGIDPIDLGPEDYIAVLISTDGGQTWSPDNILEEWTEETTISPEGDEYLIELDEYFGIVQFAFYVERPDGTDPDLRFYVNNIDVTGEEEPELFEITFNVEDESGEPLDDATITLGGETNEAGDYTFEGIEAGTYNYIVEKDGYETYEDETTITANTTIDVTLTEETPEVFNVTFQVMDEAGDPLDDATITFDSETNETGDYTFEGIETGTYNYIVEKEGYFTIEDVVNINSNITVEVIMEVDDVSVFETGDMSLNIYPNPASDNLYIESNAILTSIRMVNMTGQVVYATTLDSDHHTVSISGLHSGLYIIEIMTEAGSFTHRVQISR